MIGRRAFAGFVLLNLRRFDLVLDVGNGIPFFAPLYVLGGLLGAENSWDERPRMGLPGADQVSEVSRRGIELKAFPLYAAAIGGLNRWQDR
jgi:hypothetical protein